MSSIKKELYNHSFEDVVNQCNISEKFLHVESKKLCKSAMEIYSAAQAAYRGGDEELAFIMYMRYCNVITSLQKKADFRKKQTELTAMFGGNEYVRNALETAEALQKSLIARFNERDHSRKLSSMDVERVSVIGKHHNGNTSKLQSLPIVNQSTINSCKGFVTAKELFQVPLPTVNTMRVSDSERFTEFAAFIFFCSFHKHNLSTSLPNVY